MPYPDANLVNKVTFSSFQNWCSASYKGSCPFIWLSKGLGTYPELERQVWVHAMLLFFRTHPSATGQRAVCKVNYTLGYPFSLKAGFWRYLIFLRGVKHHVNPLRHPKNGPFLPHFRSMVNNYWNQFYFLTHHIKESWCDKKLIPLRKSLSLIVFSWL